MTRNNRRFDDVMSRAFAPFRNVPDRELEAACARVLNDLRDDRSRPRLNDTPHIAPVRATRRWVVPVAGLAAAAVIIAAVLQLPSVRREVSVPPMAQVETADGGLFYVSGTSAQAGDRIDAGELVWTKGGAGAMLTLADGSRVEMGSSSELMLEEAVDGVRIRLTSGGIIVNAAKHRTGHLYVQTKDMTVSVVGTVFLVNAEATGSRVAVLEGEVAVQVQQGRSETRLLPGEQVVTNSSMLSPPVREVIAWSRNAGTLLALLQQSAVTAPPVQPAAVSREARAAFETVSIRLASPSSSIGARGRGASGSSVPPCSGIDLQIDPSRFAVRNIPLYGLITIAYGKECQPQVQHLGGPAWVRTDGYDVEASLPAGSPGYTTRQVREGMAPRLQLMLQTMLADRFKLQIRREMREMSVYNLVVVTPGKVPPSADQNPPERVPVPGAVPTFKPLTGVVGPAVALSGSPMSRFVGLVQTLADRPVIDRTELTGLVDVVIDWPALAGASGPDLEASMRDQLSSRLQERLGLKLEPARELVEVLIIERVERPTEN